MVSAHGSLSSCPSRGGRLRPPTNSNQNRTRTYYEAISSLVSDGNSSAERHVLDSFSRNGLSFFRNKNTPREHLNRALKEARYPGPCKFFWPGSRRFRCAVAPSKYGVLQD